MSRKKQYKNRLPAVLGPPPPPPVSPDLAPAPPAPRPVPAAEQVPPPPGPDTGPGPGPDVPPDPGPARAPAPGDADQPAPVSRATLLWEEDEEAPTAVRRRRTALATLVVLLVLLAGATVGGVLALRSGDDPGAAHRTTAPSAGDATGTEPVLPGTSQVETTVRPGGTVVVRHRLSSREPLRSLSLALPQVEGAGTVAASDVRVVADGTRVAGPDRVGPRGADYDLGAATDLRVSYRLTGVVLVSGSAPGRALALATSLGVRTDPAPDEETRVVRAPRVLSLACAAPGGPQPVPCGTAQGLGEWRVDLAGARLGDRVVAQLTVPGLDGGA